MTSRMKGDEKNEKIIRGLLKLPENRRCINCNNLGPQYVCTNFWTFICMNCSGVHREFTHRVKSVSMAKFSTEEVNALQEGGNERAREIYFKQWELQQHSFPDSSNVYRLREFIRHVYVERRFTGEKNVDGPSRAKDSSENRKSDAYRGGSRSPPYDERNSRSSYEERRSPGYYGTSPGRLDSTDERHGNDFHNRTSEDRRLPDGLPRSEARTAGLQKDSKTPSPPMIRPLREILGEDPPPLRVGGDHSQTDATKTANGALGTQRATSSNSLASIDSNPTEAKRVDLGSLIDFDATPEPSAPEPTNDSQANNSGNWASFDSPIQPKPPQTTSSNLSQLEFALSGLSVASVPAVSTSSNSGVDLFPSANNVVQQSQPSLSQPSQSQQSEVKPFGAPGSQPWSSYSVPANLPQNLTAATPQPVAESQNSGRRELPADLFTGSYPAPMFPRWQVGPRIPMGFVMHYPPAVAAMPSFPPPVRSTNPFDFSAEATAPRANAFPQMASQQVARPATEDPSSTLAQGGAFGISSAPHWSFPQRPVSYPAAAAPFSPRGFPAQPAPTYQVPGSFLPPGHGQLGPAFGAPPSADLHPGLPSAGGGNPFS